MGVVYAGRQVYLDRPIAVKVLKRFGALSDPSFVQGFQREAKTLSALRHPSIVPVVEVKFKEADEALVSSDVADPFPA